MQWLLDVYASFKMKICGAPSVRGSKRIFLDYASATHISPRVAYAMSVMQRQFHNPASIYKEGVEAKKAILDARTRIAKIVGAHEQEIIFTSGGTESANLAIRGVVSAAKAQGIARPHVITTAFEHVCVLETIQQLESDGVLITTIYPNELGIIDAKQVEAAINPDTVLISVMLANNEIGTVQPLKEIAKAIKRFRRVHGRDEHCAYPYFLSDASQGPNYLDVNIQQFGIDLMILDGLKTYGPRPAGILVVKRAVALAPIMYGGAHQRGLRPGTESVAVAVGFAEALEECVELRVSETARLYALQEYFIQELSKRFGNKISLNGSSNTNERLPNNVNICVKNYDSEFLVLQLDVKGIACSSASSCSTLKDSGGSYVIATLGSEYSKCAESSVRFTMGRSTTRKEISEALDSMGRIL